MKKSLLFTLFFLQILRGVTTAQNIYESIGEKAEMLTLSNGKYQEFIPNKTIVRIGTVLLNTKTHEIVDFVSPNDTSNIVEADVASRFLSVDPIGREYPELTPYQFASNRPIDGIDLDGLEYVTVNVLYDYQNGRGVSQPKITITTQWHNEQQHNAHGNLGRGALYKFHVKDYSGKDYWKGETFVSRNAGLETLPTEYGLYMGATGLFKIDQEPLEKLGSFSITPDYTLPPVDVVDKGAYIHDQEYDAVGAVGASGLFSDFATVYADDKALKTWDKFLNTYEVGQTDPVSGHPITSEQIGAAKRGSILFKGVVDLKTSQISTFMKKNYPNEASFDHHESMQTNLNIFTNKYMDYDEKNDRFTRRQGMWNKDNTPKEPQN
jgi:hypothetical protein